MDELEILYRNKLKSLEREPLPDAFDKINQKLNGQVNPGGLKGKTFLKISKGLMLKAGIAIVFLAGLAVYLLLNGSDKKRHDIKLDHSDSIFVPINKEELKPDAEVGMEKNIGRKKKFKANSNSMKTVSPINDSIMNEKISDKKDTLNLKDNKNTNPLEIEVKPDKVKRRKKYDQFYKENTSNKDSTVKLFNK